MRRRHLVILGVAGLSVAIAIRGCECTSPLSARAIAALRERTMPPGATLASSTGPRTQDATTTAAWVLDVPLAWSGYVSWIEAQLRGEFRLRSSRGARSVWLSRTLPGDSLSLLIEPVSAAGNPLQVRVTLTAMPD